MFQLKDRRNEDPPVVNIEDDEIVVVSYPWDDDSSLDHASEVFTARLGEMGEPAEVTDVIVQQVRKL